MSCKGTWVTAKEKEKMWKLFQEGLTFAAIGKRMKRSPDTVSKYVHQYESNLNIITLLTK